MNTYKIIFKDYNVLTIVKAHAFGTDGDFFAFYDETDKSCVKIVAVFNKETVASIVLESEDKQTLKVSDYKLMPNYDIVENKSGKVIGHLNLDGSIFESEVI